MVRANYTGGGDGGGGDGGGGNSVRWGWVVGEGESWTKKKKPHPGDEDLKS